MEGEKREQIIQDLKKRATEVRELKDKLEQRRPIVIEFSGSPKSGKTSSINSLEIFLKRNGFKVRVIQEFASKCPVSDKQSPMFNTWTTCRSLASLIGVLEDRNSNVDVVILDRGIFDALCWFEWLYNEKKMDKAFKSELENLLTSKEITKCIDIVFAFTASPEVSIKREFASLLTDERGSIMNESVLHKYLEAIKQTTTKKKAFFRNNVIEINTTEKGQDEVGHEVTEKTLDTLREILMERIGYLENSPTLQSLLQNKNCFEYKELKQLFERNELKFGFRNVVENNDRQLQIIPIAVITKPHNRILAVKKKEEKEGSPEKNKLLPYIGGHSRIEDNNNLNGSLSILDICKETLYREIKEEIGISVAKESLPEPKIIYTPTNPKSKKHIAICFRVDISEETKLNIKSSELVQPTGKSKSGKFYSPDDLFKEFYNNELEDWGTIILKEYFSLSQYTIFPNITL